MKKAVLIGAIAGVAAVAGIVIKKINDSREDVITIAEDGTAVKERETFKEAAKKMVDKILAWYVNNHEKCESAIGIVSGLATVIGCASAAVELYSKFKHKDDDTNSELLREVDEIRMRLILLTPEIEVGTF